MRKWSVPIGLLVVSLVLVACGGGGGGKTPSPPQTYSVSGTIVDEDDEPIAGVAVSYVGSSAPGSVPTDAKGFWEATDLRGEVTVTPAHDDYDFTPRNRTVHQHETNVNFTGVRKPDPGPGPGPGTYRASGTITDVDGEAIRNVMIEFNAAGSVFRGPNSADDGTWTYYGLIGEVAVTPRHPSYKFDPPSRTVTEEAHDVDFIGTLISCDADDPCQLSTIADVQAINDHPAGHYVLVADIDAAETVDWNDGAGFVPIGGSGPFVGRFDGAGYTIHGLHIDRPSQGNVGLFGFVGKDGIIENVTVADAFVSGDTKVGGLIGITVGGIVKNAGFVGEVVGKGDDIGGLAGLSTESSISGSFSGGTVAGRGRVGGLVGSGAVTIATSYSTSAVSGQWELGGLLGQIVDGKISDSYSMGPVTSGELAVGGLVGHFNIATIVNTYSTGLVDPAPDAENVGGLIGLQGGGFTSVTSSYWDIDKSGQSTSAGGTGVEGKATDDMYEKVTYDDWDFDAVWMIDEGKDYPDLVDNSRAY